MAYDEALAKRIRKVLTGRKGVTDKNMFGGLTFLLDGKMFCGIVKDDLMVRVGPDLYQGALNEPHVRPMDFAGRPSKGFIYVSPSGCRSDEALARWVKRGLDFVSTLPAKKS